ncbi:putative nuclease with TOPRIM domain [Thermostichus sp. MS-CIW-40]
MTISTEERLERVERLVEANSQAIARLTQQQEEVLRRIDRLSGDSEKLSERIEKLSGDVEKLSSDVEKLTFKFDTSQTIGERLERLATSLIAGATISIIAGVILVLLREGSR